MSTANKPPIAPGGMLCEVTKIRRADRRMSVELMKMKVAKQEISFFP